MSRPWVLDCFDAAAPIPSPGSEQSELLTEEERLQAFDHGYRDGWDDAAKAHADEQNRISSELAGNLQALSFTYHEARAAVLSEMEDILKGLVSRVLPATMVPSLGEMIVERVRTVADEAAGIKVEIVVHPDNLPRIQSLVDGMIAPPLALQEEPSLGEGQAYIRLGEAEERVDLEAVLQGMSDAVAEFFEPTEQLEAKNV